MRSDPLIMPLVIVFALAATPSVIGVAVISAVVHFLG